MSHTRRGWRTSRIFLMGLWLVMLLGSIYLVTTFVGALLFGGAVQRLASFDWAGYVVVSDFNNPAPVVVGVNGSWTIPSVTVSPDDRFSAVWVGIGGQLDQSLIQTGTEQDSIGGVANYSAWYELLPNDAVTITSMNVSPGDKITASIILVDSVTNKWSIEIEDVTKGQAFKQVFSYDSSRLSAEWIVERPTVDSTLSTLADVGTVTFTNAQVTMNGNVGSISSFPFSQVIMNDRRNRQLTTVSSLTSKGSSFTVST